MMYRFKSKASGDLIMLKPQGDQLLALLGRVPAPQGIIETGDLPAALQALEKAAAEAARAAAPPKADSEADAEDGTAVGLQQRLWPMIDMLKRASSAGVPVVWGV